MSNNNIIEKDREDVTSGWKCGAAVLPTTCSVLTMVSLDNIEEQKTENKSEE